MVRMLVTRAEPDAAETAARLEALGIAAVCAPLLERATLHTSLPAPQGFAAMAVTSANALRALEERNALAPYRGLRLFAVGERTAGAARALGFGDVVSAGGTLTQLAAEIAAAHPQGPIFYPTARHQSGDLAKALAPAGIMVVSTKVYEMRAASALPDEVFATLATKGFTAALFYSHRTAEIFVELSAGLDGGARRHLAALCLSEQVAEPLISAQFVRIALPDHPSEEAMMALALSFARGQNTA
jgi:uroporphyrinogen-III synthase